MEHALNAEADAFLNEHSRSFLIGTRADGSPTGWPLIGFYPGDVVEFSTYRRAQKVRSFERNAEASCVVAPIGGDRALVMRGVVEIREDQRGPSTGETTRADTKEKISGVEAQPEKGMKSSKRVVLRFEPADSRFVSGLGVAEGPWV